jgi:hypothetical protein
LHDVLGSAFGGQFAKFSEELLHTHTLPLVVFVIPNRITVLQFYQLTVLMPSSSQEFSPEPVNGARR